MQQRRSQRVMLSVKTVVSGNRLDRQRFSEEARTSVVNAHGALILVVEKVTPGQLLTVRNAKFGEEIRGKVVDVGPEHADKFESALNSLSLPRVSGASPFLPRTGPRTAPKPNAAPLRPLRLESLIHLNDPRPALSWPPIYPLHSSASDRHFSTENL